MNERQGKELKELRLEQRGAAIIDGTLDQFRQDGYSNMLNKYGTKQDNSTAYHYEAEPIADDMQLIRLYEGNGLFTKIIDRPSEEAVKHGLEIDYGDEDITEYVDERLDELEFEDKFATAEKWARLYGGSIIVMLVDDGCGLEEPLNWKNVRSIEELRVFERAIVEPDYTSLYQFHFMDTLEKGKPFGEPEFYQVFSMYGYFVVHRSRCLVFRNGRLPEHTTNANYWYWGIPEYVKIKRALRECTTSHTDGVKLLERSVQAIYKMKNLSNMLSTDAGEDKVLQRLQIIDMARGILNSIAIDNDGEDYDYRSLTMTGVKDVIDTTCNMLSAVTNIPQTILFGRSPAGENSTGESDQENYYNMVENIQKQNMKANVRTVIDLILKQGFLEEKIPEVPKYKVKFAALWSLSEKEQAEIEKVKAETENAKAYTAKMYIENNVIDPSEVRRSLAREGDMEIEELVTEDDLDLPDDAFDFDQPLQEQTESAGHIAEEGQDLAEDSWNPKLPQIDSRYDGKDLKYGTGVFVIKDGLILCGTRSDGKGICGPGGHIQEGEKPEQGAIRETQEEFGITPEHLIYLGHNESSQGRFQPSEIYLTDEYSGEIVCDEEEMSNPMWMSIEELRKEKLFPAFESSLELLQTILRKHVHLNRECSIMNLPESVKNDGGQGSGNFGHAGNPGHVGGSASKGGRKESLPMTEKEIAKVAHDINNVYHSKYKGKRNCAIITHSNEANSPAYMYRFKNHGFDNYEIYHKGDTRSF